MMVRWKGSSIVLIKVPKVENNGKCEETVKMIMAEDFQNWKKNKFSGRNNT